MGGRGNSDHGTTWHHIALVLASTVLAFGAQPDSASATILLFDQERDAVSSTIVGPTTSGGVVPLDYGDNVTGATMAVPGGFFTYGNGGEGFTPDVTVDFFTSLATPGNPQVTLWQVGYGDLVNVVFAGGPGTSGSPQLNIRLTAAPGVVVDLYGFDLAGFNEDYTIAGVEVLAGATSLFSASDFLVEGDLSGPRRSSIEFAGGISAQELLVRLDLSNLPPGIQDNIGIDSIRFGQTPRNVPEPGTATLLLGGLAALGARRGMRRVACRGAR